METQPSRDLTSHKVIKKEVKAYKVLCKKKQEAPKANATQIDTPNTAGDKTDEYTSFADMKSKLLDEIKTYDKDERARVYECYKNYIERTNVFISSIIPMLAAFAIGVFSLAFTIENGSVSESTHYIAEICDIHSTRCLVEYNQGNNILSWITFLITLGALAFVIIDMARDSDRCINKKGFYQMIIQLIESIEKGETENSTSNPTNKDCAAPQDENSDKDSERSTPCQPNTPSTSVNLVLTVKQSSAGRVKRSHVTSSSALKSQKSKVLRSRISTKK